jgi:hypothetical protein
MAEQLGCGFDESPMGVFVRTDPMKENDGTGRVRVPRCGGRGRTGSIAIGDGARAGMAAHRSLLFPSVTH